MVSIVVPTYNSEKTIYKTLKSLVNQTYKNFEIIIVDNSESKKTINVIKKYFGENKKIKIKQIKKKILSGPARNLGVLYSNKNLDLLRFVMLTMFGKLTNYQIKF